MNKILTPISLWKNFTMPEMPTAEVLSVRKTDSIAFREIRIVGRDTEEGKVNIYCVEALSKEARHGEKCPALLLFSAADTPVDTVLAERFAKMGYCVLCVDYRGDMKDETPCTQYPEDIPYANVLQAGKTLSSADESAVKTAWYEWTAVAKYALHFLSQQTYVENIGAIGIREGGEIVWKLMTFDGLSCGVCVNAVGWLAGGDQVATSSSMPEGERMFVAGIDSQSYAPFVKCPVLMVVSATDSYAATDCAYDTFARINKEHFSTIDYSTAYNGSIDELQIRNVDMFMDKYLKNREIFIPKSAQVSVKEKNGVLCAVVKPSLEGEVVGCSVCYAESDLQGNSKREWKIKLCQEDAKGEYFAPLQFYEKTEEVQLFARVQYSSGFTASSKIATKPVEKKYADSLPHSKLLFDGSMSAAEVFYPANGREYCVYAFSDPKNPRIIIPFEAEGYGKICGASCTKGLKTYRISAQRYLPSKKSLLHFNVYSDEDCFLEVSVIKKNADGAEETYVDQLEIEGREKWTSYIAGADRMHDEQGNALSSFLGCLALSIREKDDKPFVVTNILWV